MSTVQGGARSESGNETGDSLLSNRMGGGGILGLFKCIYA